jgi:protein gp37
MGKTNIEWATDTWNPIFGCTKVSTGCARCYAEKMAVRQVGMARADLKAYRGGGRRANYLKVITDGRWNDQVVCDESALTDPLYWKKPQRIFVCSMSDLFHESVPVEFIRNVFCVMQICKEHTFMVLTKRPERMADVVPRVIERLGLDAPPKNVLLGTSCENQATADERIPHLLRCPATGRFVSVEPLLGPIKLPQPARYTPDADLYGMGRYTIHGLHNIIIGGESGPGARPCRIEWIRSLVEQAKAAGVPCFVKQAGAWLAKQQGWKHRKGANPDEWPAWMRVQELLDAMPGME